MESGRRIGESAGGESVGYEFEREQDARESAAELDRRFSEEELSGLRIYRVRWNGDYIVEATFPEALSADRIGDARAILGESGNPVHPDDLAEYKEAMEAGASGPIPGWLRRFFGREER